jgi:hypothetical protein
MTKPAGEGWGVRLRIPGVERFCSPQAWARLEEDTHNRNACPQERLRNELRTQLLVRE